MPHVTATYVGGHVHYVVDMTADASQAGNNQTDDADSTNDAGDIGDNDSSNENGKTDKNGQHGGNGDTKSGTLTIQVLDEEGNLLQTLKTQVANMVGDQTTTVTADAGQV